VHRIDNLTVVEAPARHGILGPELVKDGVHGRDYHAQNGLNQGLMRVARQSASRPELVLGGEVRASQLAPGNVGAKFILASI